MVALFSGDTLTAVWRLRIRALRARNDASHEADRGELKVAAGSAEAG